MLLKGKTKKKTKTVKKKAPKKRQTKNKRKKDEFPHFRLYKKSKHPALIVGEQKREKSDSVGKKKTVDEYKYRKVMHNEKDGKSLNEKVSPNPNPKGKKPMYIGKRVRHDEKKNFSDWKYPWDYKK